MNKKIEQLLDLALSSPAAEDMKIRAKLIEDARELDYLTVNDKKVVEMIKGLRKEDGIVHNRVNIDDVLNLNPCLTDPENLICVTNTTHNMIHYGLYKNSTIGGSLIYGADRKPNDTCPWKRR